MDQSDRDKLQFCALCPNPCRYLYPSGLKFKESNTCSALAYLGHAVVEGFVAFTPEVDEQLSSTEGSAACKAACPYGIDTAGLVTEIRREYSAR